ncbi:MAG: hypothetical protein B6D75_03630 [gamma proteobacterium symbiont of Stewartia floridana]|nr:MAG: hypothetical protein B6D75_03630 [gamma proteobacterium symbiont of Stewartia floridana]
MKVLIAILSACGIVITATVSADIFTPSHSCSKPYKPYQFTDQYELDNFMDEVEAYKRCITDFIEEQNDNVRTHQNAAEEAIDEWNNYVNYELN